MLRVIWLSSLLFVASQSTISAREFVDSSIREFGDFSVKTEVKSKLESLFGEPVLNASFRWNLEIGQYDTVQLPAATPNQTTQEYRLEDLDKEARDRVKIFNLTFALVIDRRFEKNFGTGTECILVDGGAAAEGDGETWSFNVSGSPNWDRLLADCNSIPGFSLEGHGLRASTDRDHLEYYEPERAKNVYKRLLDGTYGLKEIVPVAGEISYRELEAWFVQKYEPQVVAGKLNALQTLERGLKESFGLELPKPTTDSIIHDLQKDYYAIESLNKQIATVDRRIEKLSNLPAEFMVGRMQHASTYEASVRESRLVLQTARESHDNWTSSLPIVNERETDEFSSRIDLRGNVQISLIWFKPVDLDLYFECPNGNPIYYDNRNACKGVLDVDDQGSGSLVENITFEDGLPAGREVKIRVKHHSGDGSGFDFKVRFRTPHHTRVINGRVAYRGDWSEVLELN